MIWILFHAILAISVSFCNSNSKNVENYVFKARKLNVSRVESKANQQWCNLTTTIKNVKDGLLVNTEGIFFEDFNKVTVSFSPNNGRNWRVFPFKLIVKATPFVNGQLAKEFGIYKSNFCGKTGTHDFVINIFIAVLKNYISVPLKCPFKKVCAIFW